MTSSTVNYETNSVHDNEYDDDDDDYEEIDDEEEEEEDEDDGFMSYLLDKSLMKQHAIAILVAFFATGISYFHLLPDSSLVSLEPNYSPTSISITTPSSTVLPSPTPASNRKKKISSNTSYTSILKPTETHHHHSYRRTNHLNFCPPDFFSPSETNQERIQRILLDTATTTKENDMSEYHIDSNLQVFEVNFPKKYVSLVHDYYLADDYMDDNYTMALGLMSKDSINSVADYPLKTQQSVVNYECIQQSFTTPHRSTIPLFTMAYIQPDIASMYHTDEEKESIVQTPISVKSILSEKSDDQKISKMKGVSLSYTGFTAKLINLSSKTLRLFWDTKSKPRFVRLVEPFESVVTATVPGSTFHLTPTYDKDHLLVRWTITTDDAVLAYDPIAEKASGSSGSIESMSVEFQTKYAMQKLNLAYGREYLAKTQRQWLGTFPRPMPMHYMWEASYINQEHVVSTSQSHFTSLPPSTSDIWKQQLNYAGYDALMTKKQKTGEETVLLPEYREEGSLDLTLKAVSVTPRVFEIDDFLSHVEVEHILDLAKRYNVTLEPSTEKPNTLKGEVKKKKKGGDGSGKKKEERVTKSKTNAWLHREYSPVMDAIYRRTADVLRIDESLLRHRNEHEHTELNTHHSIAEAMHMVHHVEGQGYPARQDSVTPSILNRYQPNRFATVLLYLSDDMVGGETVFPRSVNKDNHEGLRIESKIGKAIVFYNMLPDGNLDELSHHSSDFLEFGEKWMGILWAWDPIID